jgi:hypothetical protein
LEGDHLLIDILELGVAIRVILTFFGLAIGLQAVPPVIEQGGDGRVTYRMTLGAEFLGQLPRTLGGPAQGRLRVPSCGGFDQDPQGGEESRIVLFHEMAAAARSPNSLGGQDVLGLVNPAPQLPPTGPDRGP